MESEHDKTADENEALQPVICPKGTYAWSSAMQGTIMFIAFIS